MDWTAPDAEAWKGGELPPPEDGALWEPWAWWNDCPLWQLFEDDLRRPDDPWRLKRRKA